MGTWSLENTNTGSFLNYSVAEGEQIDTVAFGMMMHNSIPGFLPMTDYQNNGVSYFRYNLKSMTPLNTAFKGVVDIDVFLRVISGIAKTLCLCDDYMIEFPTVLLDRDLIYINAVTKEPSLICLPIVADSVPDREAMFFKTLTMSMQINQSENYDYMGKLISLLNKSSGLDLKELYLEVDKMLTSGKAAAVNSVSHHKNQPFVAPPQRIQESDIVANVQINTPAQTQPVSQNVQQPAVVKAFEEPKPEPKKTPAHDNLFNGINIPGKITSKSAVPESSQKAQDDDQEGKKGLLGGIFGKKEKKSVPASSVSGIAMPGTGNSGSVPSGVFSGIKIPGRDSAVDLKHSARVEQNSPVVKQAVPENVAPPQQSASQPVSQGFQNPYVNSWMDEATIMDEELPTYSSVPTLMCRKTGVTYKIDTEPYRIGKKQEAVDLHINVATVSRVHAIILSHGDTYYIMDNHSTNHTYMNGKLLEPNKEYKLEDNSVLSFHKEEFVFNK